jgi:hypothetical protein
MKLIITKRDHVGAARKRCVKKFLRYFRNGFADEKYIGWERQYKVGAHLQFQEKLNRPAFRKLLAAKSYDTISQAAIQTEARTNLLFSFEKIAIRDAVRSAEGAELFATGLFEWLYGTGLLQRRFEKFVDVLGRLPRKQTRVLTWPLVTVFGFIAEPDKHIFLKPRVTRAAAEKYRFDLDYISPPYWDTYESLLLFAQQIQRDTKELHPRDYIDLQSFIWVLGSDEYPD